MWGDAFLISPVKEQGLKEQTVYLPKGFTWTDFYTNKQYKGGQNITLPLTINHIPVLIKGGSIIPMLEKVAATTKANFNQLQIHYYLDPLVNKSSYSLYNDDGETPNNFNNGNYEKLNIAATNSGKQLTIILTSETGSTYTLFSEKAIQLTVHNSTQKPKKIIVNGKKQVVWRWNDGVATINITLPEASSTKVILKY